MNKPSLSAATVALGALMALTLVASASFAAEIIIQTAPPPVRVEVAPPPPAGPGYMAWRPGYWRWNGVRYVWIGGHYVRGPYVGAAWVPGHWDQRPRGWVWIPGHWRRA